MLLLTFAAYALYHASRKPLSIVKNALIRQDNLPVSNGTVALGMWPPSVVVFIPSLLGLSSPKGWFPFDQSNGPTLLGEVDLAFLASYAAGMFVAGHMGDRICLRMLLALGMVGSGISVALFGLAYWGHVHWLSYFFIVQILGGLFQATGWPSVVTIVSNWFGKSKRGLIMGVWNAHTSVGNICGTLMASAMLGYGWGWSFLVPGLAIMAGGVIVFLFLFPDPESAGFPCPYEHPENAGFSFPCEHSDTRLPYPPDKQEGVLNVHGKVSACLAEDAIGQAFLKRESIGSTVTEEEAACSAVGFLQAWAIPRVAPFAYCLFFTKLVAYTFLYWLPFYIRHTEIEGKYLSDATAGNLSIIFDVGGTVGGILAGHISDRLNARAVVAAVFTYATVPALLLYRVFGSESFCLNFLLLFLAGMVVNAPYALITTAVSADLGTHKSLEGNSRSLATVTAIIDGTGSIGAAIGPLLTGYLAKEGWNYVFCMLSMSATIAGLLLTWLVIEESKENATCVKLVRMKSRQIDLV